MVQPVLAQEHDHSQMDHEIHRNAQDTEPSTSEWVLQEGSGTSLLPARERHGMGEHGTQILADKRIGIFAHGYIWAVHTDQSGPRGDAKSYVQSMGMLTARPDIGLDKTLRLRAMFSLEPLMSNRGYPNLFATGETAGGLPLVDRQHPHDFIMELSARFDISLAPGRFFPNAPRLFLYAGAVGEPALGPSAFMHRASAQFNPEAPITHHWFDSTHITYGVVTAGLSLPIDNAGANKVQLEGSIFTGREPDERRWNIEKPRFDSWSVRATWNPSPKWALQVSHGFLKNPEFLIHPGENEHRTTASAHFANGRGLSAMLAFSAKNRDPGRTLTAWLAEANWDLDEHHTIFGRIENVRNDELFPEHTDPLHEVPFRVSKFQAGYAYRMPLTGPLNLAVGGTVSAFAKPVALDAAYGKSPMGFTLFAKLSLGH